MSPIGLPDKTLLFCLGCDTLFEQNDLAIPASLTSQSIAGCDGTCTVETKVTPSCHKSVTIMEGVMRVALMAAMLGAMGSLPAMAQDLAVRASHDAIISGDFAQAERKLMAERRIYPNRSEVLLNLAAIYAQTGRNGQAAALYRQVLAQPDALMDLDSTRSTGAHEIAQVGMRRLDLQMTASR